MRNLQRNTRKVWVSLYSSKAKQMISGKWTGEWVITRSNPFPVYASLSAARGQASDELFGVSSNYSRTLIIDYPNTGITDTSVLWVNNTPEFDANGCLKLKDDGTPTVPFDYVVVSVAETMNVTTLALKEVKLS